MKSRLASDATGLRNELGASNWVLGCSIAAGVFLLICIAAAFAVYRAATRGFGEGKAAMAQALREDLPKWRTSGKVSPERFAQLEDLVSGMSREDTSILTMTLGVTILYGVMEDEKIEAPEAQLLDDYEVYMKKTPAPGWRDYTEFMQTHPILGAYGGAMQRRGMLGQKAAEEPAPTSAPAVPVPTPVAPAPASP